MKKLSWKSISIFLTMVFSVIIFYSFRYSREGKSMEQLIGFALQSLAVVTLLYAVLVLLETYLFRFRKIILPIFFFAYFFLIWNLCYHSRGIPVHDSRMVYEGGLYFAGLKDDLTWTYFARYNNNLMPAVVLGMIYRLAGLVGFKDVYYAGLLFNISQVMVSMYCIYQICYRITKECAASWLSMLLFGLYFPVFAHTQSVYTDAFSVAVGILSVYTWIWIREKELSKKQKGLGYFLLGIVLCLGFAMKITSLIPFIAIWGYVLVFDSWGEKLWILIPVGVLFLFALGCSRYEKTLPSIAHYDTWGFPRFSYFIALGMERDGSYLMESEYVNTMAQIYGMEEKKAYTRKFIWEHRKAFVDKEHLVPKLVYNFADGTMAGVDFYREVDPSKAGSVYQYVAGTDWRTENYRSRITGHWYLILILGLLAALACTIRCFKGAFMHPGMLIALLSILGIFIYVMISEANNRQLYNHLPWFMCLAGIGLWNIRCVLKWIVSGNNSRMKQKMNS